MKIITTAVLCSFLFIGCKKKDIPEPLQPDAIDSRLIEALIDNNGNSLIKQSFQYTPDSLIKKIIDSSVLYSNQDIKSANGEREFIWDNHKKLSRVIYKDADGTVKSTVDFLKTDNHYLEIRNTYTNPPAVSYNHWIGVDSLGRKIADTFFVPVPRGNQIDYIDYYTYDANDNMIKLEVYTRTGFSTLEHTHTWTYTYDQKVNPLYGSGIDDTGSLFILDFGKNNRLTATSVTRATGLISTWSCSYEYNSFNRPVKCTRNSDGGYVTVTYKYKR